MKAGISFDTIISKIAALGIPGLVLIIAMGSTGLVGAAALTTALAALGPLGMIGGIITLGVIGLAAEALSKYGYKTIATAVIKELVKKGETKESILNTINSYHISESLKLQLNNEVEKLFPS